MTQYENKYSTYLRPMPSGTIDINMYSSQTEDKVHSKSYDAVRSSQIINTVAPFDEVKMNI